MPFYDNTVSSQMVTHPVKTHEDLSGGKSYVDSTLDGKSRLTSKCQEGQLIGKEGISPLCSCVFRLTCEQ